MGGGSKGDINVGPYCYAKEAFKGMPNYYTIEALRKWRDEARFNNNTQKINFINFYYAYICNPAGKLLNKMPFLRPLARKSILLFIKVNNINLKVS